MPLRQCFSWVGVAGESSHDRTTDLLATRVSMAMESGVEMSWHFAPAALTQLLKFCCCRVEEERIGAELTRTRHHRAKLSDSKACATYVHGPEYLNCLRLKRPKRLLLL